MAVLKEVRCQWASIIEPNTKFEPVWEIEALLNDEQAAFFVDAGCRVRQGDDGQKTLRFKRKVSGNKKGGGTYTNQPPAIVDASKQPFNQLVGNGSLVNIAYSLREWEMVGNTGIAADLEAVQVLEHVPYSAGGADAFDDEGSTTEIEGTSDTKVDVEDIF